MTREPTASPLGRWLWIAALTAVVAWAFWRSLPVEWTRFESPEGGFAVEVPAAPTARTRSFETAVGALPLHLYIVEHRGFSLIASYADYPEAVFAAGSAQDVLDGARDGAANNIQARVEREWPISLDGHPGRAVVMRDSTGDLHLDLRLYLVDRRLYQLIAAGPRSAPEAPIATRYLESFALLPGD